MNLDKARFAGWSVVAAPESKENNEHNKNLQSIMLQNLIKWTANKQIMLKMFGWSENAKQESNVEIEEF